MKKILFILHIVVSICFNAWGQSANPYGQINTSITLFDLEYNGMRVPIVLQYSQLGVQVDELPDWTGQGWELNTGYSERSTLPTTINPSGNFEFISDYPVLNFFGGSYSIFKESLGKFLFGGIYTDKNDIKYYFGAANYRDGFFNYNIDYVTYIEPDDVGEVIDRRKYLTQIENPHISNAKINFIYRRVEAIKYIESLTLRADFDFTNNVEVDTQKNYIEYDPVILERIECDDWSLVFETIPCSSSKRGYRLRKITLFNSIGAEEKSFVFSYHEYASNTGIDNYDDFGIDYREPDSDIINSKRYYLSNIQKYDSNGDATFQWSFDYYSPNLLPERISYKQNAWGYYCNYTHLASKFYDLVDFSDMPEITYNPNASRTPSYVNNYETVLHNYLPNTLFKSGEANYAVVQTDDKGKTGNEVLYGMLQRIQYPLGNYKEFNYLSRPYGNLLNKVSSFDEAGNELDKVEFEYVDGAIPLCKHGYLLMFDVENLEQIWNFLIHDCLGDNPNISLCRAYQDLLGTGVIGMLTTGTNVTKFTSFSKGGRYELVSPLFKRVITQKDGLGYTINMYTTAADNNHDDLPANIKIYDDQGDEQIYPYGMGTPTSRSYKRGQLLSSSNFNNGGELLQKTEYEYTYSESDLYHFVERMHDGEITNQNYMQFLSYYTGIKGYVSGQTSKTTRYEYDETAATTMPVQIQENSVSGLPKIRSKETYTYSPVTGEGITNETIYKYPIGDYIVINPFECSGNYYNNFPFIAFHYTNGEFTGGTRSFYAKTPKITTHEHDELTGYDPKQYGSIHNVNLSQGTNTSGSFAYTDDEILVVMSSAVFERYGYQSYCKSYHYYEGVTIKQTSNNNVIYERYGNSFVPGENEPEADLVYFITTPALLNNAHAGISYLHPELITTLQNFSGFTNDHITGHLGVRVIYFNNVIKDKYFGPYYLPIVKNYITYDTDMSITRYTYVAHYETVYTYVTDPCEDLSISKTMFFKPSDCPEPCQFTTFGPPINPSENDDSYVAISYDIYDDENHDILKQVTDEKGMVTSYIHYPMSNKIHYKVVNANYSSVSAWDVPVSDAPAQDIRDAVPYAYVTEYIYDELGRLKEQIDPNGHSTVNEYNSLGKLSTVYDNDGNIIEHYEYEFE